MMSLLEWLQGSAVATWVRESPSIFAYTAVLSLHAMGLAIVAGVNTSIALRLLGVAPSIPTPPLIKLFPVMYAGLTINAFSGSLLFAASAVTDGTSYIFLTKMIFVVLGFISIELLRAKVFSHPDVLASGGLPPHTKAFATFSIVCWSLALISGRLNEYPTMVSSYLGL